MWITSQAAQIYAPGYGLYVCAVWSQDLDRDFLAHVAFPMNS